MNYPRYKAIDGAVHVREGKEWRPVGTALTANGRDLELFDRALAVARTQRAQKEANRG